MYLTEEQKYIISIADWLIDNKCSLRVLAKEFDTTYYMVRHLLLDELKHIDDDKYVQCKNIIRKHKSTRF